MAAANDADRQGSTWTRRGTGARSHGFLLARPQVGRRAQISHKFLESLRLSTTSPDPTGPRLSATVDGWEPKCTITIADCTESAQTTHLI